MKKFFALSLALIISLLSLSSCSKENGNELYYPVTEDFGTLDPQIVSGVSSKNIVFNCFEGLVRLDENGNIKDAGASSWEVSSDSKVYTFHLRQDAQWYLTNTSKEELSGDGTTKSRLPENFDSRVTAADYVFGIRRALDPSTGSADGKYLEAVMNAGDVIAGKKDPKELGIEAVDEYTVKITLDHADPDLLYYLTRPAAMPCNEAFFNACGGRYGRAMEYMLCNGVYIVYRWTKGSLIRLEKNSLYTGSDKALNDRVWVYYVADTDTAAKKIKDGTYDAGYVNAEQSVRIGKQSGFTLNACSDVLWGYWFNCKSDLFSITDMRTAFAASADKTLISAPEYIEGKTDRLLTTAIKPYFNYSPALVKYDEKKASENFKKALNENDTISASMTVTVLTTDDFADSVIKQVQIWQKVFGVNVKIRSETRENAVKLLLCGDYEIAFLPVAFSAFNTSEYFKCYSSDSAYNVTGYRNANYDDLINSITYSMPESERAEIYKKCEQTLLTYATVIPTFTEASYFVMGKNVSGIYSVSKEEVYFRNATIS